MPATLDPAGAAFPYTTKLHTTPPPFGLNEVLGAISFAVFTGWRDHVIALGKMRQLACQFLCEPRQEAIEVKVRLKQALTYHRMNEKEAAPFHFNSINFLNTRMPPLGAM